MESPLPVKNYEAQFSVVPDDDDEDEVNVVWAATYDAADGKDDKDARKTIDGIFKDGIDNIGKMIGKKGKTTIETGCDDKDCRRRLSVRDPRRTRGPFAFGICDARGQTQQRHRRLPRGCRRA